MSAPDDEAAPRHATAILAIILPAELAGDTATPAGPVGRPGPSGAGRGKGGSVITWKNSHSQTGARAGYLE